MYLWLKLIHVVAVIVFVGNITVGIFWKVIADRSRDPRIMAHTIRGIIGADRVFTIPAIVVIVAAGVATALAEQIPILGTGWIFWAIILFVIAGLAFVPVSRAQHELQVVADEGAKTGTVDSARYEAISARWNFWGMVALIAPLGAVALMILKPTLPAFH
jgi:uncharacterized membrane protein